MILANPTHECNYDYDLQEAKSYAKTATPHIGKCNRSSVCGLVGYMMLLSPNNPIQLMVSPPWYGGDINNHPPPAI